MYQLKASLAAASDFATYLRKGNRPAIEMKFNPYHDLRNGQFTFAPGGPRASVTHASPPRPPKVHQVRASRSPISKFSPHHPGNHSVHIVKKGETLGKIAALRNGLRVEDLADLNGQTISKPIQPGQSITLPHQNYLDAGKAAKDKFVKREYYRAVHGGAFPPDPANPPEILDPVNWTNEHRNGYDYALDARLRTRRVSGGISLNSKQRRSPTKQARVGKPDRLPTDEGGHYIAREFNGPTEAFNHFAQDRNFNRSAYRKVELLWKSAANSGKKVLVDIVPIYNGNELRPSKIVVKYNIDGKVNVKRFPNRAGGQ